MKKLAEVQQDRVEIERMEATGMRGTPEYEAKIAESTAKAEEGLRQVHQLEMSRDRSHDPSLCYSNAN
jgi:hypothetical protein